MTYEPKRVASPESHAALRAHQAEVAALQATHVPQDCMHPGEHCAPLKCPDCGRFSSHCYDTGPFYTQNGFQQRWGGTCRMHGDWGESAA